MTESAALPAGDYAIVEMLGHRTLVGRVSEVDKFGTKMLAIEPLFVSDMLPAILVGGASIYSLTPCTAEQAFAKAPKSEWGLPDSLRAVIPPRMLSAPEFAPAFLDEGIVDLDENSGGDRYDAIGAPA